MPFWSLCCKNEAILFKNFHPGRLDLGRKNRNLGNRAIPASHHENIEIFTEERVERRDLGNRGSPVDQGSYEEALTRLLSIWREFCAL